ncbi:MAG: BtpA/SgcQ family protein [Verrucomicrobiia bacterium]
MKSSLPPKCLAAMIAVPPLPGSPLYQNNSKLILSQVLSDLAIYQSAKVDAIVLENSYDLPYIKPPLPQEAVGLMTQIAREVRRRFPGPIGLQLLEAANETALEIAAEAKLNFIRVESYVYAHVGGAGLIEGCAGKLLRKRKKMGCETIRVFADIKKKHCSHALTADLDITDEAKQAEFFLADGLIITGPRTGEAPDVKELKRVRKATRLPIFLGSGMTPENISTYFLLADGFIIGSTFRKNGDFLGKLEPSRLKKFVKKFRTL